MKTITIMLFMLTTSAFAQIEFNTEKVSFSSTVYVSHISCVIPIGQDGDGHTELKHRFKIGAHAAIEMDHDEAYADGCDRAALRLLLEESNHRFGFVSVIVTVIKQTAKAPRMISGKCLRNYREQIVFEFGQGTVMETSTIGNLKPAVGCF